MIIADRQLAIENRRLRRQLAEANETIQDLRQILAPPNRVVLRGVSLKRVEEAIIHTWLTTEGPIPYSRLQARIDMFLGTEGASSTEMATIVTVSRLRKKLKSLPEPIIIPLACQSGPGSLGVDPGKRAREQLKQLVDDTG